MENAELTTTELCLIFLLILSITLVAPDMSEASIDNKGSDYIVGFLPNYSGTGDVELHLTCEVSTDVTVQYPVNNPTFSTTVTVNPGDITIVAIPTEAHQSWRSQVVSNNCVRAFSSEEFVCYMVNRQSYTSDASLAIPIDTFNTEYYTVHYPGDTQEFVVYAAYDNTSVTITLPSGMELTASLNRGEGYLYQSTSTTTGSLISSTRPVGVTSGNKCVAYDGSACDHIFEMLPPIAAWETSFPAINPPETSLGVRYVIVASADNTIVTYGANVTTLNSGEYFLTNRLTGDFLFEATQPIMIAQFLANRSTSGGDPVGDPAIGILTPVAQFDNKYTFSTVGGEQFAENNISIVAHIDDVGALLLDGVAIPAAAFSQIETSNYYATIQYIEDGAHTTSSTRGHGIYVEGFHWYDSYLYTGGALFQFVNPQGDTNMPICECDDSYTCSATDSRPSEDVNGNGILDDGEDLNDNALIDVDKGIFFVELSADSTNLTLTVDPFTPGDAHVSYAVIATDPSLDASGSVVVTDGAGNSCETAINISVIIDLCGDLDGDNDVDGIDRNILRGGFGSCTGDTAYFDEGDYNEDGCINYLDYQLWYQCYKAAQL